MARKDKEGVDWAAIEREYRAGVLSTREIAAQHGLSESAIRDRAKRYGWKREDASEVRDLANRRVDRFTIEERRRQAHEERETKRNTVHEPDDRIAEMGEIAGDILIVHRKTLGRLRGLVTRLADELIEETQTQDIVEDALIEFYKTKMEMNPAQAAIFRKQLQNALGAISLGSRSKTALNLASAIEKVVKLERENYRLDEETGDKTYEELLKEIHEKAMQLPSPDAA